MKMIKKDQIKSKKSLWRASSRLGGLAKGGLTILISVLVIYGTVQAGSLSPSASPVATSYTLSDVYTRLTTNVAATEGDHVFSPSASPVSTLYTLTQIYDAIPTINAAKVLTGTSYLGVDGSIADNGTFSLTASSTDQSVTAGYYSGGTLSGDADLVAGNIKSTANLFGVVGTLYGDTDATKVCSNASAAGTLSVTATYLGVGNTWCGTAGTLLANLFNGTSGAFTGGSQANGGADDYNNGGTAASGRYAMGWTACNVGNNYCGTADTGADAKDDSTGLIWSMPCTGSGCATFSDSSVITYSWDSSAVNNNSRTASQLCSDHAGWSLPHQKQLMQAYIDGSYGNLEASGVTRLYWSASPISFSTAHAWGTNLSHGSTHNNAKTISYYVRCVR